VPPFLTAVLKTGDARREANSEVPSLEEKIVPFHSYCPLP